MTKAKAHRLGSVREMRTDRHHAMGIAVPTPPREQWPVAVRLERLVVARGAAIRSSRLRPTSDESRMVF